MGALRNYLVFALFALTQHVAPFRYCKDGTLPVCLDGSVPTEHRRLPERSAGGSACPQACNPSRNDCDPTTAPICTYPDPTVADPRGACACQPGYKATGYQNDDAGKHWRLAVAGQQHRVWVSEGVSCGTRCNILSGVGSCSEVTLIAAECVSGSFNASDPTPSDPEATHDDQDATHGDDDVEATHDGVEEAIHDDKEATHDDTEEVQQAKRNLHGDTQDPALFLQYFNTELHNSTGFSLDSVVSQFAAGSGIDLDAPPPEDLESALNSPSTTHSPTGEELGRRDTPGSWAKKAQSEGEESYKRSWKKMVTVLSQVSNSVKVAKQPRLCSKVTKSVIDGCKKGVKTQVAFCKQALRDKIGRCKDDVGRRIDKCKKKKGSLLAWQCEAGRLTELAKCEAERIDVPFCEVDRIKAACCEGSRLKAQAMCSAGLSTAEIQKQIQRVQTACGVATALAKSAIKSYLSGQVLGVLVELQSVKAIGNTVKVISEVESKRVEYTKWADGLTAAAEGRLKDAKKALGPLASEISPDISNAIEWMEAAQAVVAKDVDGFLSKAVSAAGEIDEVMAAKKAIEELKTVTDDIKAIRSAALECAKVPTSITPAKFSGWKEVMSAETLKAAVAAYEKSFSVIMFAAARCQAVAVRAGRVINA
jgi:hypothetical protein